MSRLAFTLIFCLEPHLLVSLSLNNKNATQKKKIKNMKEKQRDMKDRMRMLNQHLIIVPGGHIRE